MVLSSYGSFYSSCAGPSQYLPGAVPHRVVADVPFRLVGIAVNGVSAPQRYVYASYSVTARPASI